MTVYIVDDDAAVRDSLRILLHVEGFQTMCFPSGEAFLEHRPHIEDACLLLDLVLPGIDGLELLNVIVQQRLRLHVIMMTGASAARVRDHAIRAGAVAFFQKPLNSECLTRLLRRLTR